MQNRQPKLTSTRNIKLPNPKTSAKLLEWKTCIAIFLVRRGEQLLTWKLEKDQLSIWELKISTCSTVEVQSTQFAERICTTKKIKRILHANFVRKWIMLFISCNYSSLRNNYTTFSRSIGWNQTWKHFVMNIKSCFFPKSTSPNRKRGYITLPRPSVSEILDHHRSYIVSHQPPRYHFTLSSKKCCTYCTPKLCLPWLHKLHGMPMESEGLTVATTSMGSFFGDLTYHRHSIYPYQHTGVPHECNHKHRKS